MQVTPPKVLILGLFVFAQAAFALELPPCMDKAGKPLKVDNARVLKLKDTTDNQYLDRGYVSGTVAEVYKDQTGHEHFSLQIGPEKGDTLEVVYNEKFGETPEPHVGMQAMACGDYITANAPAGGYEASPDDAIIHWVHYNPKEAGHAHGFLVMEGTLVGYIPGWKPAKQDVTTSK
jgi:hypothetical protein